MGIKYLENEQKYQYNFEENSEQDFIEFNALPLTPYNLGFEDVYYFGYSFVNNDNAPSKLRTKFFNYLRFDTQKDKEVKYNFIQKALSKLNEQINLYKVDVIVYPESRSPLNEMMLKMINRVVPNNTFSTHKLLKKAPQDIEFDYNSWEAEVLSELKYPGKNAKKNAFEAIQKLVETIHKADYFSIADKVKKNKYKKYIAPYLYFKSNNFDNIKNAKLILLLDDVATTGATIYTSIKAIRTINPDCKIIVFTVIGKKEIGLYA